MWFSPEIIPTKPTLTSEEKGHKIKARNPNIGETAMTTHVSILAEIPEELHESLKNYLESHPDWDQDRVFSAALSLFLLQNGTVETVSASKNYRSAAKVYLNALFQHSF